MSRSQELARSAKRWRIIGVLAFLLGAFLIYQKVYYEMHDFYAENFELYQEEMTSIHLDLTDAALLDQAMKEMQTDCFWQAATLLEELKKHNASATQIAEWYKILCMVGLNKKDEAIQLLEYYTEQDDFDFNREKALELLRVY
ncbi:MAG: hypothetical protein HKN79_07390 [Flavobacteriales bacterium]|nr:hypothetical protein [Flavobacteriales bacterium]